MSCSAEPTRLHPPLPVQHAVLGGLLYLDILFVLKPSLLFHDQSPAFIATWRAFAERAMDWPGGLVEYLAAALTQAYLIPWLGAGVLMAMIALPCLLTDRLMRIGGARPGHFWAWVPAICLLALAHRFVLPFSVILAACIAVAGTLFFYRVTQQWKTPTATNAGIHPVVRLAIAFPLFCVIYAVAGGAMLLAVGLCGLIEIVVRRSPITGILALLTGVCRTGKLDPRIDS